MGSFISEGNSNSSEIILYIAHLSVVLLVLFCFTEYKIRILDCSLLTKDFIIFPLKFKCFSGFIKFNNFICPSIKEKENFFIEISLSISFEKKQRRESDINWHLITFSL